MSAIGIALADWRARSRSFGFLVTAALALQFAYLFIPDRHAGYVTVALDGERGIYNAAWMGAITAILTVTLLAFVGFFVVRGAVERDARAGCAEIVAASPVRRLAFIGGKWLSDAALLVAMSLVIALGAMVMQQLRGESAAFDIGAYAWPFVLVVVPAALLIAACAVFFDVVRFLRGVVGSVVWFLLVSGVFVAGFTAWQSTGAPSAVDAFGITPLVAQMMTDLHGAFPTTHLNDVTIGGEPSRGIRPMFAWRGMTWTTAIVGARALWLAIALVIVGLAALAFDRFASASVRTGTRRRVPIDRILPDVPGLRLVRAELIVLVAGAGWWWCIGAVALAIAGAVVPPDGAANVVLPLALLLPVAGYAALGTRDRSSGCDALVLSAPHAVTRAIAARVAAAGLFGCVPFAGLLVHAPALVVVPFAAGALAIVIGRVTGTPRAFEALYLAVWYAGALNHVPVADVAADAANAPEALLLAGTATAIAASVLTRVAMVRR